MYNKTKSSEKSLKNYEHCVLSKVIFPFYFFFLCPEERTGCPENLTSLISQQELSIFYCHTHVKHMPDLN